MHCCDFFKSLTWRSHVKNRSGTRERKVNRPERVLAESFQIPKKIITKALEKNSSLFHHLNQTLYSYFELPGLLRPLKGCQWRKQ